MLLGVYWYYGFPEGLYHYDYFTFRPGTGGMAGGPAELTVTVRAPDPAALLTAVQAVAARYPEAPLLAETYGPLLRLTLGDWTLPDYAFFVAGELETVLRQQGATTTTKRLPAEATLLRLSTAHDDTPAYPYGSLLQVVSSAPKKHRAENMVLRLDCHLPLGRKTAFIAQLDALCQRAGLDVLYYFDQELRGRVNLMLFFGHGRQGVAGAPLRYTDVPALAAALAPVLTAHDGQPGLLGNFPADYPRHGPHEVRMVDAGFVC